MAPGLQRRHNIERLRARADHLFVRICRAYPDMSLSGRALQKAASRAGDNRMTLHFGGLREAISIDLGTANILAYRKGSNIVLNEPSVVAITQENERRRILAVGHEAKRMVGRTPQNIWAIRPMRDGIISDFDVAEQLIRHVIKQARHGRHLRRAQVAISVPSRATQVERRAIREAAESAGAGRVFLIDEPLAAAIGAGLPVTDPSGSMVVDIGGGTTEVAVISLGDVVLVHSVKVAGHTMDECITAYLRRAHRLAVGENMAERIKIEIGSALLSSTGRGREMIIRGADLVWGIPKEFIVCEEEIAAALTDQVAAIVQAVRNTLEAVPPELSADIVDKGIVLTGGGSLLSGMDEMIRSCTGLPVSVSDTALEDVALGAGRALEERSVYQFALDEH